MMRRLALVLLLAGCAHRSPGPSRDATPAPFAEIEQLEDQRALGQGRLVALARNADPSVRARAQRAFARLQRLEAAGAIIAGLEDPVARVRAEAAFAAGEIGLSWDPVPEADLDRLTDAVAAALANEVDSPARAAELQALGRLARPRGATALEAWLSDARVEARAGAALALGILAYRTAGASPGREAIEPLQRLLDDPDAGARYGAAYALMRMKRAEARPGLTYCLKDGDAEVRAVCARGLGEVGEGSELPYLLERLGDPDLDVRVEAARALAKRAGARANAVHTAAKALDVLVHAYRPDCPETSMPLLAFVQEPMPVPLAQPVSEALHLLAGERFNRARSHAPSSPPEPTPLASWPIDPALPQRARIATSEGAIVIRLAGDAAPRTVANFAALARRGFYDGLTWHRVVPGFVVQGGDPLGNGDGGPGYTIRCEIDALPYARGTVGMALSGKDTGGSQFFIALSRQPHLDGRYTAFGQVERGMDVAGRLREGDAIESIRVEP